MVFCGLSEEKVWTTIVNNIPTQTSVSSVGQKEKAVLQITYNLTDDQVSYDRTRLSFLGYLSSGVSSTYYLILLGNDGWFQLVQCSTQWRLSAPATNSAPYQGQTLYL